MLKTVTKWLSLIVCSLIGGIIFTASDTLFATPLASVDFETASIDQTAIELGWTKRYGNGDPDYWLAKTPYGTGNTSNRVLTVGGADVQILKPLQLSETINQTDDLFYVTCQIRGSQTSGITQSLNLAIVSASQTGITPLWGLMNDSSVPGGVKDLLRFRIGNSVATHTITLDHWYELLLIIHAQHLDPQRSYASLFYRDMTLGETDFTVAPGLAGVPFPLSATSMPQNWGYWQLRGSYAGQVDALTLGTDTPTELAAGTVQAPITHEDDWLSERDLYGYNPNFIPNPVSFDLNNRPYMRQGYSYWDAANSQTIERDPVGIQSLSSNNEWIQTDFTAAILNQYSWWDGTMDTGTFTNERITFDNQGGMYTMIEALKSNLHKALLLYKPSANDDWQVYPMPPMPYNCWTALEAQDGHNTIQNPPAILGISLDTDNKTIDNSLYLILPSKLGDGTLAMGNPILITNDSILTRNHSGGANSCITVNHKTFVAWPSKTAIPNQDGTPQYIAVYDHQTGLVSAPVLLGLTGQGTNPDNHNIPGVTVDSNGILHVVLSSHHEQFKYTHSTTPLDITQWSAPIAIGKPWDTITGSYSYVSLLCDANDTLHLVSRWAGDYYYFRLVYMQKKTGQSWGQDWGSEVHRFLMVPFRNMYSCWYHKLSMDRSGRLFLNYTYYANQLGEDMVDTYEDKWPEDTVSAPLPNAPSNWRSGITPHDPGMLISNDGGDSWHLSTTTDFLQGINN